MRIAFTAATIVYAAFAIVPQPALAKQHVDPAAIDRLVEGFTGAAIGTTGGARAPVDRRLRLSACAEPLALDWHGAQGRTVAVSCGASGGWRIFVNLVTAGTVAKSEPVIARGEVVTIAVRGRGFTVQRQGEAQEAGAVGAWIKVRTGPKSAPVSARVERPGFVMIPAG